jgi:diguanylate cyclase (GGDEF)-like protein
MSSNKKSNNRRKSTDRRKEDDRRLINPENAMPVRMAEWSDQKVQFVTRYAFWMLGLLYFNFIVGASPIHWTVTEVNTALAIYFIICTALFWHSHKHNFNPTRFRLAMWADIAILSVAVLNDPNPIPPSLLVYIMIVLGNGMRYGMKIFAEALIGSLIAGTLVIAARYVLNSQVISVSLIFFALFSAAILIYAYVLMGRIEESREQLEKTSKFDALTGLYNRRALIDTSEFMFQRLKRNHQRFVMLFADLDGFKKINDSLGHAEGDRVLKHFADIIRNSIRSVDVPARFGGDEFIILLDDTGMDEAEFIVSRIQKQLKLWAKDNNVRLSVSFGIGEAPTHGRTFNTLLEQVDKALYRSKSIEKKGSCAKASPPVLVVNNP